jgi:hypothetical protein
MGGSGIGRSKLGAFNMADGWALDLKRTLLFHWHPHLAQA